MTEKTKDIDPELVAEIRQQVLEELRNEEARKAEEERIRQEQENKSYEEYVGKMKMSLNPWVEVKGIVYDRKRGIKIELDWNDAFIKHLRDHGYKGADDDTIIQQYIAELAYSIAQDMEERQAERE